MEHRSEADYSYPSLNIRDHRGLPQRVSRHPRDGQLQRLHRKRVNLLQVTELAWPSVCPEFIEPSARTAMFAAYPPLVPAGLALPPAVDQGRETSILRRDVAASSSGT